MTHEEEKRMLVNSIKESYAVVRGVVAPDYTIKYWQKQELKKLRKIAERFRESANKIE